MIGFKAECGDWRNETSTGAVFDSLSPAGDFVTAVGTWMGWGLGCTAFGGSEEMRGGVVGGVLSSSSSASIFRRLLAETILDIDKLPGAVDLTGVTLRLLRASRSKACFSGDTGVPGVSGDADTRLIGEVIN